MHNEALLTILADNTFLFDVVKQTVLAEFQLKEYDTTLSNERLGELVRSDVDGKVKVERAFKKIAQHKTPEFKSDPINKAR